MTSLIVFVNLSKSMATNALMKNRALLYVDDTRRKIIEKTRLDDIETINNINIEPIYHYSIFIEYNTIVEMPTLHTIDKSSIRQIPTICNLSLVRMNSIFMIFD
jgi:hypothetical protein